MKDDRYITLIYKSLKGEITSNEQTDLDQWSMIEDNQTLRDRISKEWELSENYQKDLDIDVSADFAKLKNRIHKEGAVQDKPKMVAMKPKSRSWMSIAAGIAILVAGALWVLNPFKENIPQLTASTSAGEIQEIILPDSSRVILNENSTLTYPERFQEDSRLVTLSGEAFFDIERNEAAMFVARTSLADVEVLGTSFNINSYPSTTMFEVSVNTGIVQLRPRNSSKTIKMEKGQVGVFNTQTKQIYKNWANKNTDRWRTGVLSFDDQYLRDVLLEVEKEFDIETILERTDLEGCKITARLENATAESAMQYLAKTFEMKLKIENEIEYYLNGGVSCVKKVTYGAKR